MIRLGLVIICLAFCAQAAWLNLPSIALRTSRHLLSFDNLPEPIEVEKKFQDDDEGLLEEIEKMRRKYVDTEPTKDKEDVDFFSNLEEDQDSHEDSSEKKSPIYPPNNNKWQYNMLDEPRESVHEVVVRNNEEEEGVEVSNVCVRKELQVLILVMYNRTKLPYLP
ncbi:unnamed protein product [Strongylus vulgaris]|uniref:Uncharacterized protein n=1 Tax=Strongylus vulgaris TaxID=40348 RepID=A0A3P7IZX1_STRVU|nr:unnamed protein product [Strongylus vulgaris]